jgi:hypothetical protein
MSRRIITFRYPHQSSFSGDVMVIIFAFVFAVAIFAALFLFVKFGGALLNERPVYDSGMLRGVPLESVIYTEPEVVLEGDVVLSRDVRGGGSAERGEMDVSFQKFDMTARSDGSLREITFSLNGFARPRDVTGLQLYVNGEFVAEKPFFEGRATFDGLNVILNAHKTVNLEVKGKVGADAVSSDRIQIGIASTDDILIRTGIGDKLTIEGGFPLWGRYISVIGSRK